jgi:hypothetical protein
MQTTQYTPCQLFCGRMLRPPWPPICAAGPQCCHRRLNSQHVLNLRQWRIHFSARTSLLCLQAAPRNLAESARQYVDGAMNSSHMARPSWHCGYPDSLAVHPIQVVAIRGLARSGLLDRHKQVLVSITICPRYSDNTVALASPNTKISAHLARHLQKLSSKLLVMVLLNARDLLRM